MQALRGVGKEITMLMHGAPLHRHAIPNGGDRALEPRAAIDDEEIGPLQATPDEIVEDRAVLILPLWWRLPESPRYLIHKGRVAEADALVREISTVSPDIAAR